MTEVITMFDSIDVKQIPADAQAVAGYVGGFWPTYSPLVAQFPHAKHKSIAVNASEDADILDIENGDAVPADAPAWFHRQKARGLELPGFYASASVVGEVESVLTAAGITRKEYVLWAAHYTGVKPNPPFEEGADAVQFTDRALGRNLDQSACVPAFWGAAPTPPVKNDTHYDWFDSKKRRVYLRLRTERGQVELYDRLRAQVNNNGRAAHPIRLWFTRKVIAWFAKRVLTVAKEQPNHGKPSWGKFHRGWRYQQLIHRAQGHRFV